MKKILVSIVIASCLSQSAFALTNSGTAMYWYNYAEHMKYDDKFAEMDCVERVAHIIKKLASRQIDGYYHVRGYVWGDGVEPCKKGAEVQFYRYEYGKKYPVYRHRWIEWDGIIIEPSISGDKVHYEDTNKWLVEYK